MSLGKLGGALALGIGSNALLSALQNKGQAPQPMQGDARTPGFFGNIKNQAMEQLPGALVKGALGAAGFQDGGRVHADAYGSPANYKADGGRVHADAYGSPAVYREGGGGLWSGLKGVLGLEEGMLAKAQARADQLNEINEALGIEGRMEATDDQSRLMAERAAILQDLNKTLGIGQPKAQPQAAPAPAPQLGAPVTAQAGKAAPVDPNLLMEPIGGYTNPEDRVKPTDFLMTPLGPEASRFATGGPIHIKKGNEGKFTAKAKAAGMGVQEYARKVLAEGSGASPATRKQANFARNAAKWHNTGGPIMAPTGQGSFMMEHGSGVKERMGPLAKTMYKNKGGEVWERQYHNPMAGLTGGSKDKEE